MEQYNSDLSIKESALRYLDAAGILESLKKDCSVIDAHLKKRSLYCFNLFLDPFDVIQLDGNLGNCILNRPMETYRLFQEIYFETINILSLIPGLQSPSQVYVSLKLLSLPDIKEYILRPEDLLSCKMDPRYYKFTGIVCSLSTTTHYTFSAHYMCPHQSCEGSVGYSYIRVHYPGAKEMETIRNDFSCMSCGEILEEDVNSRTLAEKRVIQMFTIPDLNKLSSRKLNSSIQSISVFLRDDLVNKVEIGGCYEIIGLPSYELKGVKVVSFIEANNVKQQFQTTSFPKEIPGSILNLYEDRKSSPWSFVASLAYLFAGDVTPPGTYHKLKMAMLFSLMEIRGKYKLSLAYYIGARVTPKPIRNISDSFRLERKLCRHSIISGV